MCRYHLLTFLRMSLQDDSDIAGFGQAHILKRTLHKAVQYMMYHMKNARALTFQNAWQPLLVAAADALAHEYRARHKTDLGKNSQQVFSM
jgi:hypothetical protein